MAVKVGIWAFLQKKMLFKVRILCSIGPDKLNTFIFIVWSRFQIDQINLTSLIEFSGYTISASEQCFSSLLISSADMARINTNKCVQSSQNLRILKYFSNILP